jgi:hypothetical protein
VVRAVLIPEGERPLGSPPSGAAAVGSRAEPRGHGGKPHSWQWVVAAVSAAVVLAGVLIVVMMKHGTTEIKPVLPMEPGAPTPPTRSEDGFVPLFNGKDLTGWHVESGDRARWAVEEGAIVGKSSDRLKRNYLLTNRDYDDFTLRLQFLFEPESFGAVALRAIEGENIDPSNLPDHPLISMGDYPMKFNSPNGTAYWIQKGEQDERRTDPTQVVQLTARTWHATEITMQADQCVVLIDGIRLQDLRRAAHKASKVVPALERKQGKIGLKTQIGAVRSRNIEIKELSATNRK